MAATRRIPVPFVGASAPSGPADGALWWDTDDTAVDGGGVLTATKHVTSAQILASFDTPVEIIAAPGAGKMLLPITGVAKLTAGATPYATSGSIALEVLPAFMGVVNNNFQFLESAVDYLWPLWMDYKAENFAVADAADRALSFHVNSANPTDGDGTLDFVVYYVVSDVP